MPTQMTAASVQVGGEYRSHPRPMTRERMRWYCDALDTATINDGTFYIAPPNIHNSDEFAKNQGLPAIIADGMISTNWLYGFLLDTFGPAFLARGEFATKFVRPVMEDQKVACRARVTARTPQADGSVRCDLDLWCEDDKATVLTVGTAAVFLPG
jgi:3-hydroxybutyryl-CoA dehydratase